MGVGGGVAAFAGSRPRKDDGRAKRELARESSADFQDQGDFHVMRPLYGPWTWTDRSMSR
jgi:hypothetical protein